MIGKFAINTAWLLLLTVVSGLIYIRLAPHDQGKLHAVPPKGATPGAPVTRPGSALFSEKLDAAPKTILEQLNTIALATPRSQVLAANVDTGMITYVTRSAVFGFPDYTTVHVVADGQGSQITLFGRLRFGKSDFGVNRARIRGWLKALEALNQAG